ncbi:nucleoporin Nup186/Nup192/Nup205 [Phellopilus nigrolimitatus]|nr:nucleoporin Nup186/Nup192/Nup205 [Phellopilus nigrolimitatus]
MESIASLRAILVSALNTGGIESGEQELFDELTVNRPRLIKVFDFGPRSQQEQREIESGRVVVDGHPLQVNAEFARQVAFISQQLNCSERYCAGFLHSVLTENPTINQIEAVEQAILAFHETRRELADCLRFVFEAADAAEKADALPVHARLNDFVKRQLVGSTSEGSVAYHIFAELNNSGAAIANARAAVTNAVSNTNVPGPQGGNANLGHAVLAARLESLLYERRTLGVRILFCCARWLRQVLEWLERNPRNDMTLYILATLFAALDLSHSPPGSPGAELRVAITNDSAFMSFMRRNLAPTTDWKDLALRATVHLKWTLFLTEARFRNTSLEHVEGFRNEDLEMQVFNAVQGDAFTFLLHVVSQLSAVRSTASQLLSNSLSSSTSPDAAELKGTVPEEFKLNLLHEIELLLRSLLTHAPAELRKIKHKQEDQFRPRGDRHMRASFKPAESAVDPLPTRNDIATLFQLLGHLYSALPTDSAIQFWGGVPNTEAPAYYELAEAELGKLPSFLRWAVEVREPDLVISVFDMLAGLSTGVACSECAYNFMATGTLDVIHGTGAGVGGRYEMSVAFTWGSIFGELETWAALGAGQRGQHGAPPPQLPIAPTDVLLGLAFLRLLSAVATHSVQARIAVFSHPQYRAVGCLVSLIPLGVPLELKGALFETLSAFCLPGAGIPGVEICKSVWAQMERLEVINVRGGGFASKGVEVELEEVESVYKVYPATIPFLELLSTLIHTPKRVPLKNRVTEPEPINTVPENLGQPYRAPGIGPFVSFVVDNVLAKLTRREFLDPFDNSKMTDLSLCFVERCLASFDLESLPSLAEEYNVKGPEVLFPVIQHPGFDVLSRILSETPLRATLISFVVEGADELHRQPTNSRFAKVLLRALRIMDRVLAIQDIFLDHLVPALSELDSTSLVGSKISQSFLSRIDQGLSLDHRSVPAIGSYVNFPANPETMFLAIKILASLSQSPSFQNISALIERSSESTIILDGFVRLLASDSADDVGAAEEWTDLWTGAGAPDLEDEQDLFAQAIRVAILDLLLRGTKHNKSSSLAFLLLFGKVAPDAQIQDPHALGSRAFCLHVVLHLLNTGVPRLTGSGKGKEKEKRRAVKAIPLFESQPVLAERLYKLIYQLCEHSRTSSPLMLYLRTREDFFARHLSAMAVHAPFDARTPFIEVLYGDGSRVATTCTTMKAFLRLRSWLLDLVSLELHVLTNKGQNQRVKDLLDLLFGTTDSYHESESDWEHDVFRPFNDVSQSRIRLIELFQSLEFEWYDSVTVTPVDLQFYTTLNLQSCVRADENGCEVVDRTALFELLSNARRTLMRQGQIASTAHNTQLDAETRYILESCVVENNRREVQFALNVSYESWKRLADVVLTKCFGRIAHDQRENILFDLLHVLPPAIRVTALPESSAILLSEVLFLLITKLREERRQAYLLSSGDSLDSSALPEERMATLLRHILDCILDKNRRELVRGNIYAALVNFLHLVIQPSGDDVSLKNSSLPLEASLSSMASSLTLSGSEIMRPQSPTSSLELNSFTIMKQSMDRLVTTVSKDAIDGTEVWKTVAFTLLESLARLSRLDTKHLVLTTLERYGLLSNFVHSIKDADSSLQDVLRPEPDDLNPLYVYEAKMSFLIRIAQTRQGAERLLESRILPILSQVDFLDARPEADESFLDHNSFLPSAISRYHELLVPALQLVGAIVATVGSKHAVASKQALDFLYNHRDTFVIMLKQETTLLALSTIEELDLLVSLCAFVVLSVPQTDFYATNSGFGSIHNAILALAARTLGTSKWLSAVRPTDETEIVESQTPASGYGVNDSKFDIKVRQVVQKTRKTVMRYLSAASSVGESELIIVLSPMMTTRRDERSSAVTVPLPSLQDTIDVLNGLCDELLSTMQEIVDISAELEHRDHVRIDNVEELVGGVDADAVRRLDVAQRRSLVCRFYERTVLTKKTRTDTLISTIEMLLHLLWTHISYYISERASSPDTFDRHKPLNRSQLSQSQSHLKSSTLRFLTVPDPGSFRADAAAALARIVEKVEGIELSEDFAGRSWRSKQSYLEVMCRCLREAVAVDSAASGDGRE